jgi:2-amino-4-hydroxy-6-hydroxymethyldihydropteridine diphosphokinase
MVTAFLGLGSNLGNRLALLQRGREQLAAAQGVVLEGSSALYEAAAQGCPPGSPAFLNAVLRVRTGLTARQLLELCLTIEAEAGRSRSVPNAPRTLDIDLLLYGAAVIDEPGLQVPHPRLPHRAFVLAPLLDVAATLEHPVLGRTLAELAAALPAVGALTPFRREW